MEPHRPKTLRRRVRNARRAVRGLAISLLVRPLLAALGRLTPKGTHTLADALANLAARLRLQAFQTVCANLAVAFPDLDATRREQLARQSIASSILTGLETARLIHRPTLISRLLPAWPPGFLDHLLGQPAIVCLPHLGNWEVFAHGAPLAGLDVSAIAETLSSPTLDAIVTKARESNGLHIIKRDGAAKKVLLALRQGHSVGMLVDQNLSPADGGIFVSFFGLPATMSPLPARLARRLHLPITVCASIRQPDGHFACVAIHLPPPAPDDSDESLSQRIADAFETLVRDHPEQYVWLYKRWRYLPQNLPEHLAARFPAYAVRKPYDAPEDLLQRLQP